MQMGKLIEWLFHMLMGYQSDDNKPCSFLLKALHALLITDTCQKRLISSSDFIQSKRHEEPTLHDFLMRKYWINLSKNACGSCLDICLSI